MLLLSSPRCGRQRRASLLLLFASLLCIFFPVSVSLPARVSCPPPLDCVQLKRHHCKPGSSSCGPCLSPFQENEDERCVLKKRHKHGKVTTFSDLDEEIDFLHSVIEKQEIKPSKIKSKSPASISLQTDAEDRKTNASKQKNQDRLSSSSTAATTLPNTPTPQSRATGGNGRAGPIAVPAPKNDSIIVIMISLCVVVGSVAVILATVCYIKVQKESRLAEKVDYPASRGTGVHAATDGGTSMGDKTLAQSAQMYHYQHQKQQMLSLGNHKPEQKAVDSEVTSDEEEVGGGFTVYECPGLAPTGEMEVKNPLFDDSTLHYQGNHK
ncbi:neural proliferation differentiation and control protein 1a [Odontesthes bonariensis]|uniref:neural proliferation differentiation and control protein 1a n=1 Tax=Odontesthes bonariensis TaxID=219752 RepID=UPI003F589BE6